MGKKNTNMIQEKFQAQLAARIAKKNIEEKKDKEKFDIIIPGDLTNTFTIPTDIYLDFTTDKEIIEYLNLKTLTLLKINGAGNIVIGKELTEVFEKLSTQGSSEGLYTKFLEVSGYKQDTALRYRKRYELFTKVSNNATKQIISVLPVRILEKLYKNQELLNQLDREQIEYKEAVNLIKNEKDIILIEEKKEKVDFELTELSILKEEIENKYEKLPEKNQEKLKKLLLEIKDLLKV